MIQPAVPSPVSSLGFATQAAFGPSSAGWVLVVGPQLPLLLRASHAALASSSDMFIVTDCGSSRRPARADGSTTQTPDELTGNCNAGVASWSRSMAMAVKPNGG